jgi:peptide/nickel transport system permease protein
MINLLKILFLVIVFYGFFSQNPPIQVDINNSFCSVSFTHPMGCDRIGRDILAMFSYGSLLTIMVAVPARIFSLFVSLFFCLISYSFKNFINDLVNSISAVFLSIPSLLIALVVIYSIGKEFYIFLLSLILSEWAAGYETINSKIRELKNNGYILVSRIFGANDFYIFKNHILPDLIPIIFVLFLTGIPAIIMTLSIFSYLGIDVGAEYFGPGLGEQISFSKDYFHKSPLSVIVPILGIFLVVNLFNFKLKIYNETK